MQSFGSTDEKNVLFLDGTDLKISVPAVAACGTRAVHGKQWLRVVGAASAVAEGYEKESRTRLASGARIPSGEGQTRILRFRYDTLVWRRLPPTGSGSGIYVSGCHVFDIPTRRFNFMDDTYRFPQQKFFKLASCTLEITRASLVSRIFDRDSNCYDMMLRGVKCVSKSGCAASLSAKSLSLLRPVENPRRKHCAEVGRTSEWKVVALSERTESLLKRLYDRVGNSRKVLNGPFTDDTLTK
ncbi:hypothetical protein ALC56_05526 [Trachymyrmex septentrionalis]|uniref:Uncharacterized protein n=1 Tax=Trachymyrmex septentrionalis TaxID=34720 RepID=A0A151JY01_9HYME|nr:hypothetical protein ALC56_05526 [Trachymyrmex septentrionalis]